VSCRISPTQTDRQKDRPTERQTLFLPMNCRKAVTHYRHRHRHSHKHRLLSLSLLSLSLTGATRLVAINHSSLSLPPSLSSFSFSLTGATQLAATDRLQPRPPSRLCSGAYIFI
jgi:hypothetical protein